VKIKWSVGQNKFFVVVIFHAFDRDTTNLTSTYVDYEKSKKSSPPYKTLILHHRDGEIDNIGGFPPVQLLNV
jgi:hypothetical protein